MDDGLQRDVRAGDAIPDERRVTEVLIRARQRIADRCRWTRYALAYTRLRHEVPPLHPYAARWCAVGAVEAECGTWTRPELDGWEYDLDDDLRVAAIGRLEAAVGGKDAAKVNDRQGHAAVLAMFDDAIRQK